MRRVLDLLLVAYFLVVGLAPVAEALPFRESPEWWLLKERRAFAGAYVGDGANPSQAVIALRLILARADGRAACAALLDEAEGPAGQLYALCGLWLLDRPACERAAARLGNDPRVVDFVDGCSVVPRRVGSLLRHPRGARLRDAEDSLHAYAERAGVSPHEVVLDVLGGGFPLSFRDCELGPGREALRERPDSQRRLSFWLSRVERGGPDGGVALVEGLLPFGGPAVSGLLELLGHRAPGTRLRAASALRAFGAEGVGSSAAEVAKALGERAAREERPEVLAVLLRALRAFAPWAGGASASLEGLLARVEARADLEAEVNEDLGGRVADVLWILARVRPPRAEPLRRALRHPNEHVVSWALEEAPALRAAAASLVPELVALLSDPVLARERAAAGVLAELGPHAPPAALRACAELLERRDEVLPRLGALALGRAGWRAKPHADSLRLALDQGALELRAESALALCRVADEPSALPELLRGIERRSSRWEQWWEGSAELEAFARRSRAARRELLRLAPQLPLRRALLALDAIARCESAARDQAASLRALADAQSSLQLPAARALYRVSGDAAPAFALLRAALQGQDVVARRSAAYGLLEFEGLEALSLLSDLLVALERDAGVAYAAALSCRSWGPAAGGAVPALIAQLRHEDESTQAALCEALAAIGPPARPALSALRALSRRSRSGEVRREAERAVEVLEAR